MFKKVLSLGLMTVMLASSVSVFAREVDPAKWALSELNDAEAYGVAPKGFEKGLNNVVSPEQMSFIIQGLRNKCIEAKLVASTNTEVKLGTTRGEVLEAYYTVLKDYSGLDLKNDYIAYMSENQIIKGYGKEDLRLEQPCTVQEALVFASRVVESVYDQLGLGTDGFLWEVSDENNTIYLLGTVHIGKSEVYPLSKGLRKAIEASDKVSFEVDFANQEGMMYLAQKQMYLDGTTLDNHVDEETYKRIVALMEQYGVPEEQTKYYKPWALSNTLTALTAQDTESLEAVATYPVIDAYVYSKALLEDKEILEIEGYAFQADLLDGIPVDYQIQSLKAGLDMVEAIQSGEGNAETAEAAQAEVEMMNSWIQMMKVRDIEGFEASYPKDSGIESGDIMTKALFEGRDAHMTEKVVEYLNDTTDANYFVAVGAGHMIGKEGIVKRLQELGYTVKVVER